VPFKSKAEPEDYPERHQKRPKDGGWVSEHQTKNMKELLGNNLWTYLEKEELNEGKK